MLGTGQRRRRPPTLHHQRPDATAQRLAGPQLTRGPSAGRAVWHSAQRAVKDRTAVDDGVNDARGADSATELARQKAKIVSAISDLDADVVGLIELENDPSDAPIADLAAATGLAYVDTGAIGVDAIAVGFLYDPSTVAPVGQPAILDSKNRPALAQTFEDIATGERVNVVVNHLKSKGSPCDDVGDPDAGDEQGNCNGTRTAAALALANWLADDPTGNGDPDNLIVGDLNAYSMEDPITTLEGAGYTDLVESLGGDAPSFIFRGEVGRLDHGLANSALAPQVTGAAVWAINMEEPRYLDYNDDLLDAGESPFSSSGDPNPVQLYQPDEFRSSDHNPVVIGLDLFQSCLGERATIVGTPGDDRLNGTGGRDVIVGLAGDDRINGLRGDDVICGGEGDDRINGNNGSDLLDGGPGVDIVHGNGGIDGCINGESVSGCEF